MVLEDDWHCLYRALYQRESRFKPPFNENFPNDFCYGDILDGHPLANDVKINFTHRPTWFKIDVVGHSWTFTEGDNQEKLQECVATINAMKN